MFIGCALKLNISKCHGHRGYLTVYIYVFSHSLIHLLSKDYPGLLSMPFSEHCAETCITRRVVINVPQLQYKHSGGSLFHTQSADFWQDHHCWGKECCVYYFPAPSTPVISHPGPNLTQVVFIIKTCCVSD